MRTAETTRTRFKREEAAPRYAEDLSRLDESLDQLTAEKAAAEKKKAAEEGKEGKE